MKVFNNMNTQAGVALVLSLLLLLTMTLIGVAAMSATSVQERMSGNQKRITDGQLASEVGTLQFFDWLSENLDDEWGSYYCMDNPGDTDRCNGLPSMQREGEAVNGQHYWVESLCWEEPGTDPVVCTEGEVADTERGVLVMMGHARQGAAELSETRLETRFEQREFEKCKLSQQGKDLIPTGIEAVLEILPACGIVSQDEVRFNGGVRSTNATIYSDLGIDTSVLIQGDLALSDANIEAAGEIDFPEDHECNNCAIEPDSPWDLHDTFWDDLDPANFSDDFLADAIASTPEGETTCPLTNQGRLELSGDQGGRTYYCSGDTTVKGDFTNAVIFVDGNMTHQAQLDGPPADPPGSDMSMMVATGDIHFHGCTGTDCDGSEPPESPFEGIFWAGESFRQSGDSSIFGSVVARGAELGGAEFKGELLFEGLENQGLLDAEIRLAIHGWRQIWR